MTAFLIKFVLPFIIQELVKSGAMSKWDATMVKDLASFVTWIKSLKTYSAPEDFPKQRDRFGSN